MSMTMVTLENGLRAVVTERQAAAMGRTGQSGFAAELRRTAEAAETENSGGADLKAAYDRLSDGSKAVLRRLKAGEKDITLDEWSAIRRELRDAGLIAREEFVDLDPNKAIVGYVDANGSVVSYPFASGSSTYGGGKSDTFWGIDWNGEPFQYLDKWLAIVRGQRDNLDLLAMRGGPVYDTSHLTRQIEANEKVAGLVKSLLECC